MANAVYNSIIDAFATKLLDWVADDWRVALVDSSYVFSQSHTTRTDINSHIVAVSGAMTGKSVSAAIFDATDVVLTGVSGSAVGSLVIYQHTGTNSTSKLGFFIDTGTGISFTPNGGDVTVSWSNGSNKIAKIGS